jgi:hypothetical protein
MSSILNVKPSQRVVSGNPSFGFSARIVHPSIAGRYGDDRACDRKQLPIPFGSYNQLACVGVGAELQVESRVDLLELSEQLIVDGAVSRSGSSEYAPAFLKQRPEGSYCSVQIWHRLCPANYRIRFRNQKSTGGVHGSWVA